MFLGGNEHKLTNNINRQGMFGLNRINRSTSKQVFALDFVTGRACFSVTKLAKLIHRRVCYNPYKFYWWFC